MKVVIIGASGYSGAELASLVASHNKLTLAGIYVSEASLDKEKYLSDLYPQYLGLLDQILQPLTSNAFADIQKNADFVCLCTDHKVSIELAPIFIEMGKKVFDLSGGFRLSSDEDYQKYYGFSHQNISLLNQAVYGLAEWQNTDDIKNAQLIAVPGCYPTAALNALKPLVDANLVSKENIIINAVSGVTGAGRKANVNTHFCEVSLAAYGLLTLSTNNGIYFLIVGLGMFSGLFAVVNAVTWPRYFGRKFLGAITGKVMSFLVIATALAPSLFSYCFTSFGSYRFISYILLPFLVFLLIGSLKITKPQK